MGRGWDSAPDGAGPWGRGGPGTLGVPGGCGHYLFDAVTLHVLVQLSHCLQQKIKIVKDHAIKCKASVMHLLNVECKTYVSAIVLGAVMK